MARRTTSTRTGALTAVVILISMIMPPTAADTNYEQEVFVFHDEGGVSVTIRYADGLATTRMGFFQIEGTSGQPADRFSSTAECTEWIGTFSQIFLRASPSDNVTSSELRVFGALRSPGASDLHVDEHFIFDLVGGPGAIRGSLLICDDPVGTGLARLTADIEPLPFADRNPTVIRAQVEVTSE